MSWAVAFDDNWHRDVGYGVPAYCDHPKCDAEIHRGLSYVCGGEPFGGEHGCGLHFCGSHLRHRSPRGEDRIVQNCPRCMAYKSPYKPKPDHPTWIYHKLSDESWEQWRQENPNEVALLRALQSKEALATPTSEGMP